MFYDLIKQAMLESTERQILRDFGRGVEQIMAPFKPGAISFEVVENFNVATRKLSIRIPHMGTFTFPIEPFDQIQFSDILGQLEEIWHESRVEPDDHIILGAE